MTTRISAATSAMPIKGRLTRRAALQGSAAAALVLATGNHAAEAKAPPMQAGDPVLLDLASRVEKLAGLCRSAAEELSALEDRLFELCPPPTPMPQPQLRNPVQSTMTETALVTTVTQLLQRDPAWVEWEIQSENAKRTHEEAQRAAAEQIGLPKVRRIADRQEARLDRLSAQLAAMPAVTLAEVGAKAMAASALIGRDGLSGGSDLLRHASLVVSALEDASRIAGGV